MQAIGGLDLFLHRVEGLRRGRHLLDHAGHDPGAVRVDRHGQAAGREVPYRVVHGKGGSDARERAAAPDGLGAIDLEAARLRDLVGRLAPHPGRLVLLGEREHRLLGARVGDRLRDVGPHLVEQLLALLVDLLDLDQVEAEGRLDDLAQLAGLEREGGVLEGLDHPALAEEAEFAALDGRSGVLGVLAGDLFEARPVLDLLAVALDLLAGSRAGLGVGVLAGLHENVARPNLGLLGVTIGEMGLVLVGNLEVGRRDGRSDLLGRVGDHLDPDPFRVGIAADVGFVELLEDLAAHRDLQGIVRSLHLHVGDAAFFVTRQDRVTDGAVVDGHAVPDHVLEPLDREFLAHPVLELGRGEVRVAQRPEVVFLAEPASDEEGRVRRDRVAQFLVADREPELVGPVGEDLPVDQAVEGLLPQIQPLAQFRGELALECVPVGLDQVILGPQELDLIDGPAVHGGHLVDRLAGVDADPHPPEGEDTDDQGEGHPDRLGVLVRAKDVQHGGGD